MADWLMLEIQRRSLPQVGTQSRAGVRTGSAYTEHGFLTLHRVICKLKLWVKKLVRALSFAGLYETQSHHSG